MANTSLPDSFWERWYEADEPEQLEMVEQLVHDAKLVEAAAIVPYSLVSLMNSYFRDIADHLERRFEARCE